MLLYHILIYYLYILFICMVWSGMVAYIYILYTDIFVAHIADWTCQSVRCPTKPLWMSCTATWVDIARLGPWARCKLLGPKWIKMGQLALQKFGRYHHCSGCNGCNGYNGISTKCMIFNGFVLWGIYMDLPIPESIAMIVGFNGIPFLGTYNWRQWF